MYNGIVLDTNGIISIMENRGPEKRLTRLLSKRKIRIITPEFVLLELKKIRGLSKYEIISYLKTKARRVSVCKECEDVKAAAQDLERKYPEAHYPDSILLATAMFGSYSIVTYDQGMTKCAKAEGIRTICPKGDLR